MTFFNSWRRKIGVLALVMALVFLGGWVRSLVIRDSICFGLRGDAFDAVASATGTIRWAKITPGQGRGRFGCEWNSEPLSNDNEFQWEQWNVEWRRGFGGFDFGSGIVKGSGKMRTERWAFPYWSIVIPLTLISGCLFFSKPRKSTQKKIGEPTPDKTA